MVLLESVDSRETIPATLAATLALERGDGGAQVLAWGAGQETPEKTVPLEDVLFLRFPGAPAAGAGMTLFLRDGAELSGSVVRPEVRSDPAAPRSPGRDGGGGGNAGEKDTVPFLCPGLSSTPFSVPLDAVKGLYTEAGAVPGSAPGATSGGRVLEEKRAGPQARVRLRNEILRANPRKDQIILLEEGRVEGLLESLEAEQVRFSSERLGDLRIGYDKIRAVILADVGAEGGPDGQKGARKEGSKKSPSATAAASARITLRDGTVVPVVVTGLKAGTALVHHVELGDLSVPLEAALEIQFLGGRLSYLSDLEPIRTDERFPGAIQARKWPHQRDANVLEGPLRMNGREYRKGLGVHAYSLLEYDLGGQYSRFQALIGLDEIARPSSSFVTGSEGAVIFRVHLDGQQIFEKPLSWRDPPLPIDLAVKGGKTLRLEVACGAPGDASSALNFALDRADWVDARIVK